MAIENVNLGWLKDANNNKFAPKTLASQAIYNNTISGLNSTSVQGAIDELVNNSGGGNAESIIYDNSESEMDATNVQDAIDKLWDEINLRALKTFEVIYMVDSGKGYREEVQLGSSALLPTSFTPVKEGYSFVGWRRDNTPSNEVLTECTVGEDPIILYAVFRREVIVTFKSWEFTTTRASYEYYNNAQVAKPSVIAPNGTDRSGYRWRGWSSANSTASNASVSTANGGTIYNVVSGDIYYGLYEYDVTVTYNGNGNTGGSTAAQVKQAYYNASGQTLNPTFTLATCGFTRSYGTFKNWAKDSPSGTKYNEGSQVTLSSNTTFYVVWLIAQSGSFQKGVPTSGASYTLTFPTPFPSKPTLTYTQSCGFGDTKVSGVTWTNHNATFSFSSYGTMWEWTVTVNWNASLTC